MKETKRSPNKLFIWKQCSWFTVCRQFFCSWESKQRLLLCALANENQGRKKKSPHSPPLPTLYKQQTDKKIKKQKNKKQKQTKNTFAPEMDFTASIVVCLYFGVPTNHSRDQPAWSISSVDSLCISWVCWKHSSEDPLSCLPNHYSKILQSVDTAERRAETLVSSLLAQEDVTMLKWSGNIKEQWALGKGIFPPTTLGEGPWVVGVGTTEGSVN